MGAFYLIGGLFLLFFSISMSSREKSQIDKVQVAMRHDLATHHYEEDIQRDLRFKKYELAVILGYETPDEYIEATNYKSRDALLHYYMLRDAMKSMGYDYKPEKDTVEHNYAVERWARGRQKYYPGESYKGTDMEGL